MKYALIGLVMLTLGTARAAQCAEPEAATAKAEIVQFYADLKKVLNSDPFFKDPSIAFPYFDMEKFRLFDVMAPEQYRGEALRKHFLAISVDVPGILDFIDMAITTDGKVAFVSYIMIGEGQQKDGPKYHLRSRATDGLVKTDGKWRIVHEHLSMAVPRDQFAKVLENSPPPAGK